MANNPRAKDEEGAEFETRTRGQRSMHFFRDAIKFVLDNLDEADLRGAKGAHTQLIVMADYPTLIEGIRKELAELLPEIEAEKREMLLSMLAEVQLSNATEVATTSITEATTVSTGQANGADPRGAPQPALTVPPEGTQLAHGLRASPKTTNLDEILDDVNLDRLHSRISQGIYTPYIPPDVALRILCNVSVTPVTLTGQREVLSIGQKQRQFPDHLRKAIMARDRGCAVPGCHWPAAWCEIHHEKSWAKGGATSAANGVVLCGHHHAAVHAKMLKILKEDGEFKFLLHRLIDPEQKARKSYFWQS